MTFTLTIEMGNDAMQTYADIAHATQRVFADFSRNHEAVEDNAGRIYDANGNKVGTWSIDEVTA